MDTKLAALIAGSALIAGGVAGATLLTKDPIVIDGVPMEAVENQVSTSTTMAAVIENGVVTNTVVVPLGWSGKPGEWQPPAGAIAVLSENAAIGDPYVDGKFAKPASRPEEPVVPEPTIEELKVKEDLTVEEQKRLIKYLIENKK